MPRPRPPRPPATDATRDDLLRADSCEDLVFTGLDLQTHDGVCFDPTQNDARGAVIPIDTAALIAMQLGLHVTGLQRRTLTAPLSASP